MTKSAQYLEQTCTETESLSHSLKWLMYAKVCYTVLLLLKAWRLSIDSLQAFSDYKAVSVIT